MATLATVVSLEGQAWAKAPDGTSRPLQVGDIVAPNETVITAAGARIELDLGDGLPVQIADGQQVVLSPDLWTEIASESNDAAVQDASVQEAFTVLNRGGDLTEDLEATAAGLAGTGADEGHSFVQLTRVVETTNPNAFDFAVNDAVPTTPVVDESLLQEQLSDSGAVKEDVVTQAAGQLQSLNQLTFETQTNVVGNYGNFSIDANGNWNYVLNNDDPAVQGLAEGATLPTESFVVTGNDGSSHTVRVTVTGSNDIASIIPEPSMSTPGAGGPMLRNDEGNVKEDVTLSASGKLLVSDADIGEAVFQAQPSVVGAHGTFSIDPNGNWTYVLNNDDPAVQALREGETLPKEVFNVVSADGTANHNVTITITGTNFGPMAEADSFTASEGVPLTLAPAQLLANDTDPDGDVLSIVSVQDPANGTVALVNGNVVFTPNANYNGPASFTYSISDGQGGTSTATVSLNVQVVNQAPVSGDQNLTTLEDTPLSGKVVATDPNNDTLDYNLTTTATNGTVTVNPGTGEFVYTPGENYNGSDSFVVTVSDGKGGTTTSTINIGVTPVDDTAIITPAAGSTDLGNVKEDVTITTVGKLDVTDPDAGEAEFQVQANVPGAHGDFSIDKDGNWTYNLNNNDPAVQGLAEGATLPKEVFTVKSIDGTTHVVTVTITGTNDAPVAVADNGFNTAEDAAITLTPTQLLGNDSDLDGDTLSISSVQGATHGSVALVGGNVVFTPDANYNGPATFTYTITDGNGGSSTATVSLAVTPVNDPAIITPAAGSTDLGNVKEDVIISAGGKLDVTDPDAGEAEFQVQANVPGAHGDFSIDKDGNWSYNLNNNDPAVQGLAEGATLPKEVFAVKSIDGTTHVVTVTITGTNDAPVAVADNGFNTAEDAAITLTPTQLLGNDSDLDGDTLSISSVQGATHGSVALVGGNVVFTPDANYNGPATFTYTITDGNGGSSTATVSLAVTPVNDAPIVDLDASNAGIDFTTTYTESGAPVSISDTDILITDVDSTNITGATIVLTNGQVNDVFSAGTMPSGITATVAGNTITLSGAASLANYQTAIHAITFSNSSSSPITTPRDVTVTVTDGDATSATAHATINVVSVNNAPVAVDDPGDTVINSVGLHAEYYSYYEGPNGLNLGTIEQAQTFIANHGPDATFIATKFDYGTATLFQNDLGRGNNLQKFLGADAASLSNDPGDSGDAIIRMSGTVELAAGVHNFRVYGDDGYQIKIDGVVVAQVDANQPPTSTVHSNFTIATSGLHQIEILYWDQGLQAVFKVEISSDNGASYDILSSETTTHVSAHLMNEDTTWTVSAAELLANDSDADGDTLSIVSVQNAVNGTAQLNSNGSVSFTPTANYSGAASYTYTISDGHGGTSTATVSISVLSLNDAPQANGDIIIAAKNTGAQGSNEFAITISQSDLLVNDTDVDGNKLSIISVSSPVNGYAWLANGDVMFLPAIGFTGTAHFNYTISDNHGGTSTATVDVMVASINGDAGANTINGTEFADTIAGLAGNDTINGLAGDDVISGGAGNDVINGGAGNDLLKGDAGNDTLNGGDGNDKLFGGTGNDILSGGLGNDLIEGGVGNDQLTGGAGADTFVWHLVDKGTLSTPAKDVITDFTAGTNGDKLDFKDLLQNENSDNLSNYLHFSSNGIDTTISISSAGEFNGSNYASSTDQTIVLSGVNLTGTDNDIINQLKNNGNLITD